MSLLILFVAINLYNKAYLARRVSMRAAVNSKRCAGCSLPASRATMLDRF